MLFQIMLAMIMSLSMNMLIMMTPITMGLNVLMMAMMTAIMFSMVNSSWMAFLIFLIYISGTLIMFSYFVAMTPNSTMTSPLHFPLILLTPFIIFLMYHSLLSYTCTNMLTLQTNTFFNKSSTLMMITMAVILLFTMIIVVKLTTSNKGPLRPFNYV